MCESLMIPLTEFNNSGREWGLVHEKSVKGHYDRM